jgi:hypothetical protein
LVVPNGTLYIIYSFKGEMAFPERKKDEKKLLKRKNGKK